MKKFPKKDWQWNKCSYGYDGVHSFHNCLTWYSERWPGSAGGGASTQSFKEFAEQGPPINDVPKEVIDEIYDLLNVPIKKRIYSFADRFKDAHQ